MQNKTTHYLVLMLILSLTISTKLFSQSTKEFHQVQTFVGEMRNEQSSAVYKVPEGMAWEVKAAVLSTSAEYYFLFVNNKHVYTIFTQNQASVFPIWLKSGDRLKIESRPGWGNNYFISVVEYSVR